MRKLIIAMAGLAAVMIPAASASAQGRYGGGYGYGYSHNDRDVSRELRECRRELRRADSRREYRRELRECRREIARAQRRDRWDDRRGYGHRYRRGW